MLLFRSDLQAKTQLKFWWKMLCQCPAPANININLPPFSEVTIKRLNQSLPFHWHPVQKYSALEENLLSVIFFLFFHSFLLNNHAAFPSSFLLLIPFLGQSCSQASLFRKTPAGVNRGFFSCRVPGDYWAPEELLGPLDNLYVWAVEYLQFPEEKKEVHWKLLLLCRLL